MERLDYDSILGQDEIDTLFADPEETAAGEPAERQKPDTGNDALEGEGHDDTKDTPAEAVDPETLFEADPPESVGKEEEDKGKEEPDSSDGGGTSPDSVFSSIASACAEEGIFPDLDEEQIGKVKSAEDFRDLIESQIKAGLTDVQRRVSEALGDGADASGVRRYEHTLAYLDGISEKALTEESEKGEQLRRSLIYQDYLNRGYTQEKAGKLTDRTIEAGTDVDDAREALQSNKDFFKAGYSKLRDAAREKADKEEAGRKERAARLKDSLLKDKALMGDMEIESSVRKKAYENITKPVWRDPDTGDYYTALQRYEMEHPEDFMKYVGLLYTLTGGFKDFGGFAKGQVRKGVQKGLRELEHVLNGTRRNGDGSLRLTTTPKDDPESVWGRGMRLDL